MSREAWIATLVSFAVSIVIFGLGVIAILAIPGLGAEAQLALPVIVLASVLVAPYLAWGLALRMGSGR